MNWAYFHLVINHFPIIGVIIGTLLLFAGLVFKNQGVQISGLATLVFATLAGILAYLTGNPAEELARTLPDSAQSLVSRHEEIASIAMYLLFPAGLLAAVTLFIMWKKEKATRMLLLLTLALSVISCAVMVYVGRTGGQIRHSEFRDDATKQYMIQHQYDKEED
ncbi:MAG: DUF2231 domain-containing protein [Bacteroidota bacterium]